MLANHENNKTTKTQSSKFWITVAQITEYFDKGCLMGVKLSNRTKELGRI